MTRVQCPKCGSEGAWFHEERDAIIMNCLCGLNRVVSSKLDGGIIIERIDSEDEATLPRFGSKLYNCLVALVGLEEATTGEIAEVVNEFVERGEAQSTSSVASHLTVLRYKGLVEVIAERKGVVGGSTWRPTPIVMQKLKGVGR